MTTVLTSTDTNARIHTKLFHITFGTFERIDHINFPINTLSKNKAFFFVCGSKPCVVY